MKPEKLRPPRVSNRLPKARPSRDSPPASAGIPSSATSADAAAFDAWWLKYGAVEQAVRAARERRRARAAERRRARAHEFGGICELTEGRAVAWRRDGIGVVDAVLHCAFRDAGFYAYMDFMRRESGRGVSRMKAAVRRPCYYAAENARRRALAAERRKVRDRRTDNPCPTKEQILDAWIVRRRSHEDAVRFGSLVEDLECYIDNSLRRDEDGVIIGRNPGVKGWLRENIPVLALQYTTVMRYKAAAKKLKQIIDLSDPTPVDVVLQPEAETPAAGSQQGTGQSKMKDYGADEKFKKADGNTKSSTDTSPDVPVAGIPAAQDQTAVPSIEIVRARAIWEEIIKGVGRSATALFERLDALTDPERVEDANMLAARREKYKNEITVRTKKLWWMRKWKKSG